MNDIIPLYNRIEVLEKTVALLLDRLNLELIQREEYVYLRPLNDK